MFMVIGEAEEREREKDVFQNVSFISLLYLSAAAAAVLARRTSFIMVSRFNVDDRGA